MKKISISQIDTLFVNGNFPIEFIFFYKYKIKTARIRRALKRVSSSFWPLFGIYDLGLIQFSKYSEDKFFSELTYNNDFTISKDEMENWKKYNQINPLKMEGLFFLSILQFNNGTVIIPKMNHLVGDGYSYFYFLSVLAAISSPSFIPFRKNVIKSMTLPKLNRTSLRSYHFNKVNIVDPVEHQNCKIKIEKVNKTNIMNEIKIINTEYNTNVTPNDILSAIVYKKTFEQTNTNKGNGFTLTIPMDVRRQVKEMGAKFFGNGLMFHHLNANFDELENSDYREIALKLRKSQPSVNMEEYVKYLGDLELKIENSSTHSLSPYDPEKGCLVTNLSRMPIKKLNFGSGGPEVVFPLTIGRNAAAIFNDKNDYLLRLVI